MKPPLQPPGPGILHIWRVDVPDQLPENGTVLSPEENDRARRTRHEPSRRAFVSCRAALHNLLAAYTGRPPGEFHPTCTTGQKPECPECPPGLHFNLTHSGGTGFLAFHAGAPVGIDFEPHRLVPDFLAIARRFFHPAETEAITHHSDPSAAFLAAWTRKEAVVKARGTGIASDFGGFQVEVDPDLPHPALHWDQPVSTAVQILSRRLPEGFLAMATWGGPAKPRMMLRQWPPVSPCE